MNKKLVSLVFPMYNEEGNVFKLFDEVKKVVDELSLKYNFEIIFVNDGSKDGTIEKLNQLYKENSDLVKVLCFARNYGHQIAVTAGQDIAKGDAVIIMDSDLQDPPSLIVPMLEKYENGCDIVYAKRKSYKTNFTKKASAYFFYRILKKIASVEIPVDTGDFRLLSKRVNEEMRKYKEKSRYLRGMTSLMGFKSDFVEFDRGERFSGTTHYPFKKQLKLALNGITGFSTFPLSLISMMGIFLSLLAFVGGGSFIVYRLFVGGNVSGWLSMMTILIFFSGLNMLMIGILGEYIGRIYTEVIDRPLYTVDYILGENNTENNKKTIQRHG